MQSKRSSQTDCSKNRAFRWSTSRPNMEKDRVGRRGKEGKREMEYASQFSTKSLHVSVVNNVAVKRRV